MGGYQNGMRDFKIITILLLVLFFSCKKQKSEYPEIIVRHNLEEQYDLAKWELYKLNCVIESEYEMDFVVNIESDSVYIKYSNLRKEYHKKGENIFEKRLILNDVFGEKNIVDFIECELDWIEEIDSSKIFNNDEIRLTFFPKKNDREYYQKLHGDLCYTVIFKNGNLKGCGCGDYIEWDFDNRNQTLREEKFIEIIKNRKDKIHPWILEYYQNYKK